MFLLIPLGVTLEDRKLARAIFYDSMQIPAKEIAINADVSEGEVSKQANGARNLSTELVVAQPVAAQIRALIRWAVHLGIIADPQQSALDEIARLPKRMARGELATVKLVKGA